MPEDLATRSLEQWLRWQETLHPKAIALGLERVRRVAGRLDLPGTSAVTLTVAGTNGKGSSATLAASIYREAGYRVGLYTSPHLLHYNERVSIDGEPVDDAALCRAFAAIEAQRGAETLTYFEFGTLAALWLFREAGVEIQVLEVGLGGRLDAVNLVDADAALLTNVGLDHQDWLGNDLDSIGREKAGVFRAGKPAIIAERTPPQSVLQTAQAVGASLLQLNRDFRFTSSQSGRWRWHGGAQTLEDLPPPGLAGPAQFQNAAGVLMAVAALQTQLPVKPDAIRVALSRLQLPGRLQRRGPYLLDVAHNVDAAQVLRAQIEALAMKPVILVLGMLADKPALEFVRCLSPVIDRTLLVSLSGPRGLTAADLQQRITDSGLRGECCDNMRAALAQARRLSGPAGLVVVTGSFLTVAEAVGSIDE